METKNIYQRMSAITDEINRVAKNLTVGEGKSAYKAAGEADILAAVKPAEAKHGIYSYPLEREIIETNVLTNISTDYTGNSVEKKQLFMRIRVVYRFINVDNPDQYIDIVSYGDGIDPGDKGCGKAMTYADKYALMKAYKIETGDDPDQNPSEPIKTIKPVLASADQVRKLSLIYTGDNLSKLLTVNGIKSLNEIPAAKADALIHAAETRAKKAEGETKQ